jgi:sigma-B regulation protein RsbQ
MRPWFDQRYRVVSFDLAGAGTNGEASYDHRRHGTLLGYVDDMTDILDELAIEGALFIGHSVSGMVGAAAALARPEAYSRMVMIGASPRYRNDVDYKGGFDQSALDVLFAAMSANFQAWGAGFVPAVVGVADSTTIQEFSRTLFQMRPDIAIASARTIFQTDMRDIAGRLTIPTHLIQAVRDVAVPLDAAQWLRDHIAGSTLEIIDAQGHVPHMTAPDEVIRSIASHIQ